MFSNVQDGVHGVLKLGALARVLDRAVGAIRRTNSLTTLEEPFVTSQLHRSTREERVVAHTLQGKFVHF